MNNFVNLEKSVFLNSLQKVLGVASKENSFNILSNVLLEKYNNNLYFTTTDTEIQITTFIENVETEQEQAITLNAKKLANILKSFEDVNSNFILKLDEEKERVNIKCGQSRFYLQTLTPDEFPKLELEDEVQSFTIEQRDLKNLLKQTQYAIAVQDIRYYLNGLLLSVKEHKLELVATDGHRLAYAAKTFENELPEIDVIIPRKTIMELIKLLSDNGDITIFVKENQIRFEFDNIVLVSKVIDGHFPDYNNLIDNDFTKAIIVNKDEFVKSLQRVAIIANDRTQGVSFNLSKNKLLLLTKNIDNEEAKENLQIPYSYDDLSIGFNIRYVLEPLLNIKDEEIIIRFVDETSSALITSSDEILEDEDFCKLPIESTGNDKENDFDNEGNFISKSYFKYIVMPMTI